MLLHGNTYDTLILIDWEGMKIASPEITYNDSIFFMLNLKNYLQFD